jgi:hypothetical protein
MATSTMAAAMTMLPAKNARAIAVSVSMGGDLTRARPRALPHRARDLAPAAGEVSEQGEHAQLDAGQLGDGVPDGEAVDLGDERRYPRCRAPSPEVGG